MKKETRIRKKCEHYNFKADVSVTRLTPKEGMKAAHFSADVKICCVDCGQSFKFLCSRVGSQWNEPAVAVDSEELRCPIHPSDGTVPLPPKFKGYNITSMRES